MNCGFSEARWTDYLDRSLPAKERHRIESHLQVCASCRLEVDFLRQIDQLLRIEGGRARESLRSHPAPGQMAAAQARILEILRDDRSEADNKGDHERLWRMRWVLALLCGSNTATQIIHAAESHSAASAHIDVLDEAKVGEHQRLIFLRHMAFLTTEVCGSFAGELIWAVGK
jgi:anti-sigma factor RsiW